MKDSADDMLNSMGLSDTDKSKQSILHFLKVIDQLRA